LAGCPKAGAIVVAADSPVEMVCPKEDMPSIHAENGSNAGVCLLGAAVVTSAFDLCSTKEPPCDRAGVVSAAIVPSSCRSSGSIAESDECTMSDQKLVIDVRTLVGGVGSAEVSALRIVGQFETVGLFNWGSECIG
jgi:hypothetical protein